MVLIPFEYKAKEGDVIIIHAYSADALRESYL